MPTFTLAQLLDLMMAKPFRGKTGPEDDLAMEVANFLRAMTLEGKMLGTWTMIPHEVGATSLKNKGLGIAMAKYAKAKAMGLITGSADMVFVWPNGGGWIELKSKDGSLSPAQRSFKGWCEMTKSNHAVCRTLAEVKEKLFEWGVLR